MNLSRATASFARLLLPAKLTSVGVMKLTPPIVSRGFVSLAHSTLAKSNNLLAVSKQMRLNSNLSEILSNEVAAEASNDDIDQEYLDAKKSVEKVFKLVEEDGKGLVTLERKYKNETITVTFDCQDEEELEMTEEQMERSLQGDDNNDESELATGINFNVCIEKGTSKMVVSCTAGVDIQINEVRHVPSEKRADDEELYAGPVFYELDEQLQDAFYQYLEDRNVDQDLSFFIVAHSQHKEQKEYVNWLNKLLEFTSK